MSKLISGKEAWNAVHDGISVEFYEDGEWGSLNRYIDNFSFVDFKSGDYEFRLKLDPLNINGFNIEIPKEIVNDPVTGSVELIYGNNKTSLEMVKVFKELFGVE